VPLLPFTLRHHADARDVLPQDLLRFLSIHFEKLPGDVVKLLLVDVEAASFL